MLIPGLLAAVIYGIVYGLVIWYIPFIYANILLTLGVGALIGMTIGKLGKWMHARNVWGVSLAGALGAVVTTYIGWIAWILAVTQYNALLFLPHHLIMMMQFMAKEGVWSSHDVTPTGFFLYAIWAIEFICILSMAVVFSHKAIANEIYCENCKKWVKQDCASPALMPLGTADQLKLELQAGNVASLLQPNPEILADPVGQYAVASMTTCPDCQENCYLTVDNITATRDKDGKLQTEKKSLLQHALVPADLFIELKAQWEILAEHLDDAEKQTEMDEAAVVAEEPIELVDESNLDDTPNRPATP
jgi:hypothetical protein